MFSVHYKMYISVLLGMLLVAANNAFAQTIELSMFEEKIKSGEIPQGWTLRKWSRAAWNASAQQQYDENNNPVVKLHSDAGLTFLQKTVDIDIRQTPYVSWRWKVDNILSGIDERTVSGDDHPIRIFFVFEPDPDKQSWWFKVKRFFYLDRIHGHPFGGRYTEYLWSSHLASGEIINDPGKPLQKLIVVEGGNTHVGEWRSYSKNLYDDFKMLYGEEPRKLVFIGILNDTDQTGLQATSYIADLRFSNRTKNTQMKQFDPKI